MHEDTLINNYINMNFVDSNLKIDFYSVMCCIDDVHFCVDFPKIYAACSVGRAMNPAVWKNTCIDLSY